MAASSSTTYNF